MKKIYSVEDGILVEVPENKMNYLIEEDWIHYDGRNWLFFDNDYETIKSLIS